MSNKFSKKKWTLIVALVAMTATVAYCQWPAQKGDPETTGKVINAITAQPIEGAYVMAIYQEAGSSLFGHSATWCVKTKGMYTGKDGAFRFPGYVWPIAIKPDFTDGLREWSEKLPPRDGKKKYVRDPNIYLKPQDPANPGTNWFSPVCDRWKSKEDVVANIEFLKLELVEYIKYVPGVKERPESADGRRSTIRDLEESTSGDPSRPIVRRESPLPLNSIPESTKPSSN